MGNFSRNTFDALKHYVGVRMQQGVPLVDADWNELEDIRRFELQAFLKWFVGDGVPSGNDGFKIAPAAQVVGNISLLARAPLVSVGATGVYVFVDLERSTAAVALGFGPDNAFATGLRLATLSGAKAEPFALQDGMKLFVGGGKLAVDEPRPPRPTPVIRGLPGAEELLGAERVTVTQKMRAEAVEVTFSKGAFKNIGQATAREVITMLAEALVSKGVLVGVGWPNTFSITGGDGSAAGAGRCLVEGWDVLNPASLDYTAQALYDKGALSAAWGVDTVDPLTTPAANRTDLAYLDIWEREVRAAEDEQHLVNPAIGVETCTRIRREWAVRVLEGCDQREVPATWRVGDEERSVYRAGHVYYPLALLRRKAGQESIQTFEDLRRTGLGVIVNPEGVQRAIGEILGDSYRVLLARGGQPRQLNASMRDAVNSLILGSIPPGNAAPLPYVNPIDSWLEGSIFVTADRQPWVFWPLSSQEICCTYLDCERNSWQRVAIPASPRGLVLAAFEDDPEHIVLIWAEHTSKHYIVYLRQYNRLTKEWGELQPAGDLNSQFDERPVVVRDSLGQVWIFWHNSDRVSFKVYAKGSAGWGTTQNLQYALADAMRTPIVAAEDGQGNMLACFFGEAHTAITCRLINLQSKEQSSHDIPHGYTRLSAAPTIKRDFGGSIFLSWNQNGKLFGAAYTDEWHPVTQLAEQCDPDMQPHMAFDTMGMWVFWVYQGKLMACRGSMNDDYQQGLEHPEWRSLRRPIAEGVTSLRVVSAGDMYNDITLVYVVDDDICYAHYAHYGNGRWHSGSEPLNKVNLHTATSGWAMVPMVAVADNPYGAWVFWIRAETTVGKDVMTNPKLWYRHLVFAL